MGQLDGRVALVTGAARGQGRAHARALAADGAIVVACDIAAPADTVRYPMPTPDDLEETVSLIAEHGGKATSRVVDVRDSVAVDAVVTDTVSVHGRIDILVANAGICAFSPAEEDAMPRLAALSPMGVPWLQPEDVTRAVMYLVTDPGFTSGSVVEVNLATSASKI